MRLKNNPKLKLPSSSKNAEHFAYATLMDSGYFLAENNSLFYKQDSYYARLTENEEAIVIRSLLFEETSVMLTSSKLKDIAKRLKETEKIQFNFIEEYRKTMMYVNVQNGAYDILNKTLISAEETNHIFNYRLNFNYVANADIKNAPHFLNYCNSSLSPEKTEFLLEILGYCISSLIGAKKAFFFIGEPSCGKSVLLNVIEKVVGEDNVSNIAFKRLGDKFCLGHYENVRINICKETRNKPLTDTDNFKSLVSNERMYSELKGINGHSFYSYLKLLTASNYFPQFADMDEAIIDRLCILHFDKSISRENWDINLEEHLFDERDIIFSLALDKLQELVKNNYVFNVPEECRKYIERNCCICDSVKEFIDSNCKIKAESKVFCKTLYEEYLRFCDDNVRTCLHKLKSFK